MRRTVIAVVAALAWLVDHPAYAGDLYATAEIGISGASGDSGGSTDFFDNTGDDSDSSPVYGGAAGIAIPINELLPTSWDDRLRSWRVNLPTWDMRFELEGLAGRDYELRTDGGDGYFTEVDNWVVMHNWWMDVPIRGAVEWAFGRFPLLEPVSVYAGGGIGMAGTKVSATDNVSSGSDRSYRFAWQASAGFEYELTEYVTLSAGYRYFDLGEADIDLNRPGGIPFGDYTLDARAHEFTTGVRVTFYTVPWPDWD